MKRIVGFLLLATMVVISAFCLAACGSDGKDGANGADGKSAYEIWLGNGYTGTQSDFLEWLKGQDGVNGIGGMSAYEIWLADGNSGTQADFIQWLKGQNGNDGKDGADGVSVVKIEKTDSDGLIDTYTVFLSDGTQTTFTVTNGSKGDRGNNAEDVVHDWQFAYTQIEPTCQYTGIDLYSCAECGIAKIVTTDIVAHSYDYEFIPPTCTEQGYSLYTCSVCGDCYTADYVPETGHNYIKAQQETNCVTQGIDIYTCQYCNDTYTERSGNTGAHSFTGSYCDYCNAEIAEVAEAVFDISAHKNREILEYVIYRGDGFYDCVVLGCGDMKNEYSDNTPLVANGYAPLIKNVYLDEQISSIGDYAFYGCKMLTEITIPESIAQIGTNAFNCCGLTSISIPDSVTVISGGAFYGCADLSDIHIGDSLTYVGRYAFSDTAFYKNQENWDNDVIYLQNVLLRCRKSVNYGEFLNIRAGTTLIAAYAFEAYQIRCAIVPVTLTNPQSWSMLQGYNGIMYYCGNSEEPFFAIPNNVYLYSENEPPVNQDNTAYDGNYWHYDIDGVTPMVWSYEQTE